MEVVSGHLHVSLEFILGKNPRYPFYGLWNRSERLREEKYLLPLPGMEPQAQSSTTIDWDIPVSSRQEILKLIPERLQTGVR